MPEVADREHTGTALSAPYGVRQVPGGALVGGQHHRPFRSGEREVTSLAGRGAVVHVSAPG